ncbi:putative Cytochrome P450 2G1 [Hypsibius exemplaris]|uniref:Cytochrome P450 2G1 n=1 Tax=Hypsibius exemplaris TaxID=2072580 RepID=A0A1W0WGJ7_HYPEX|nr:putative Cytochrome P450 2G1 [Hypsibius exemplaris]
MATLYLGSRPVVFVKDLETIKKMAHADEYTGRPLSVRDDFFQRKGLIFTDGDEAWTKEGRFALTTLRNFGMGKTWLQDLIVEEAQELVADLRNTLAKPVNPMQYLSSTIANVVCAISLGKRFSHEDENSPRLSTLISETVKPPRRTFWWSTFPSCVLCPSHGSVNAIRPG